MVLPANYGTGLVIAKYIKLDGNPDSGTVLFRAVPNRLLDPTADTIITPKDIIVSLDVNGAISVNLPATNDPDISPFGFTYTVIENLASNKGQTYSISVGVGTTLDLVDVIFTDSSFGIAAADEITTVLHNWDTDGWTPFTTRVVSADPGATQTTSVTTPGRGRVTAHASASFGNYRVAYIRAGTNWANSRITSLWWGSNVYNSSVATPQMGVFHRGQIIGGVFTAVVITNNIFLTDPFQYNQNLWQSDITASILTLGDAGGSKDFNAALNRSVAITSKQRINFAGFINSLTAVPSHLYGMAQNDIVNVASSDSTFTGATETLTGANTGSGSLSYTELTTLSTSALAIDTGTVTPPIPKKFWPMWMVSELIGTTLRVKVWRYQDQEPDWGSSGNVQTYDITAATNLVEPAGAGYCGLIGAHGRSSSYQENGYLRFDKLAA